VPTLPDWLVSAVQLLTVLALAPLVTGVIARLDARRGPLLLQPYEAELIARSVAYSPAHAETAADRAEPAEAARRHLEETLARVRDRADRAGVPLAHAIIEGDHPAEDLLHYPHEHGFDLLVTRHHRSSRGDRLLLRGVPERLLASADLPVLIVGERNGNRARIGARS
jgi:nucleotide-binding universal stress UspA family protein